MEGRNIVLLAALLQNRIGGIFIQLLAVVDVDHREVSVSVLDYCAIATSII